MEDKSFEISLKCLFCDSPLKGDSEQEFESGDMIECMECHELNDYDSVKEIAIEEGTEQAAAYAIKGLENSFKQLFK